MLSLAKMGKEDRVLQMIEMMGMTLEAEPVTLSACQTGLGPLVRGEGMVGFTHGFLYAGAKRLVVSLWAVNDQAVPGFMEGFYREMRGGRGVAEALRAAKLGMLRSGVAAYRHPHFWGAFVGVGGAVGGSSCAMRGKIFLWHPVHFSLSGLLK